MIINIPHCFVPIFLPDNPNYKDINDAINMYKTSFILVNRSDDIRAYYDTISIVYDEMIDAVNKKIEENLKDMQDAYNKEQIEMMEMLNKENKK